MKAKKHKRHRSEQIQQVSAGLRDLLGMTQWRKEHPKATWAEIEAAVDEHMNQVRAQVLQDLVQMGESEDWRQLPPQERPQCASCGEPLSARGEQTRWIQTTGGQAVQVTRTYGTCPACGEGFFPLDEQLGLLAGGLTPRAEETLVRLATWMPYAQAQELLADLVGIGVSKATARRATLTTGQAALALDEAEEARLKQEAPQAPEGADKQQLSADGAMVHLVGGEWVEVKTLILGEVTRNQRGEVCTQQLSTFSRLAEAERFTEAALVETHRRGLERASAVCAVQDGAEWLQKLVDYQRADAVRIVDFAHAAEYLSGIGQAVQAAGGRLPARWFEGVRHWLKHQGPERVLKHLSWLAARYPKAAIQEKLAYVQKREAHMQYPIYQQAGWPIGSGSVESANKVVVEARLKGAGMRWERHNVNPLLTLRNAVCNRRWNETWQATRKQRQQSRQKLRDQRTQVRAQQALRRLLTLWLCCRPSVPRPVAESAPVSVSSPAATAAAIARGPRRPAVTHPWRRPLVVRPKEAVLAKK